MSFLPRLALRAAGKVPDKGTKSDLCKVNASILEAWLLYMKVVHNCWQVPASIVALELLCTATGWPEQPSWPQLMCSKQEASQIKRPGPLEYLCTQQALLSPWTYAPCAPRCTKL